ncbi:MAG TPA: hypothetical protein VM432_08400 [Bdellovibrionales bacterium]|nr:hypothetical protein [Bdellovibrionales bacterium]
MCKLVAFFVLISLMLITKDAFAQEPAEASSPSGAVDAKELEKALANPISNVTTFPVQYNWNFFSERDGISQTVLNLQPVFSSALGSGTVINRFILPIVDNPTASGEASVSGFADAIYQGFYAPGGQGAFTWGVGPTIQAPTGSALYSTRKWSGGPAIVALHTSERLTIGALITQLWSFAGSDSRDDVSLLTIQPFTSYRIGNGWSLNPFNNITYDSTLEGEQWTVPIGLSVIKLIPRKAVPVNLTFGVFGNILHPDEGPDWSMKAQINFVL